MPQRASGQQGSTAQERCTAFAMLMLSDGLRCAVAAMRVRAKAADYLFTEASALFMTPQISPPPFRKMLADAAESGRIFIPAPHLYAASLLQHSSFAKCALISYTPVSRHCSSSGHHHVFPFHLCRMPLRHAYINTHLRWPITRRAMHRHFISGRADDIFGATRITRDEAGLLYADIFLRRSLVLAAAAIQGGRH